MNEGKFQKAKKALGAYLKGMAKVAIVSFSEQEMQQKYPDLQILLAVAAVVLEKIESLAKSMRYRFDTKYASKVDFEDLKDRFKEDFLDFEEIMIDNYIINLRFETDQRDRYRLHYIEDGDWRMFLMINLNFKSQDGQELRVFDLLKLEEHPLKKGKRGLNLYTEKMAANGRTRESHFGWGVGAYEIERFPMLDYLYSLQDTPVLTRACELIQTSEVYPSISGHLAESKNYKKFSKLLENVLAVVWQEEQEAEKIKQHQEQQALDVASKVQEMKENKLNVLLKRDEKLFSKLS